MFSVPKLYFRDATPGGGRLVGNVAEPARPTKFERTLIMWNIVSHASGVGLILKISKNGKIRTNYWTRFTKAG